MANRPDKILLVEPNPPLVELLIASLSRRFDAQLTCVVDAQSCLDVELLEPHDLVIAEWNLVGGDGLKLTEQLMSLSARPVILMADSPSCPDVIAALRAGVRDFFVKPFPVEELLDAAQRVLYGHDLRRRHAARYRRLRELVRHVIRERRDLNRRIELVCRDLVEAHRRLVHRVVGTEGVRSGAR